MPAFVSNRLARWRRQALAYTYNFNEGFNEAVIAEAEERIGASLNDPDDARRAAARTMAHYMAQLRLRPAWSTWSFEIASVVALPFFLLWARLSDVLVRSPEPRRIDGVRLVFPGRFRINPEVFAVPGELTASKPETRRLETGTLSQKDLALVLSFLKQLIQQRVPFPAQLALKCAADLAKVRLALRGMRPDWVMVYWEFSCALSFVAWVLKTSGIRTFNVMHGDKSFYAKNAFFETERCYCWDAEYVELFKRLRVRADFRVFQNPAFQLSSEDSALTQRLKGNELGVLVPSPASLGATRQEAISQLKTLSETLNALTDIYDITIRPHPLYEEDFILLKPLLRDAIRISNPAQETPREFILRNAVLTGTRSTLLMEAAHLGRDVIIIRPAAQEESNEYHAAHWLTTIRTSAIEQLPDSLRTLREKRISTPVPAVAKS